MTANARKNLTQPTDDVVLEMGADADDNKYAKRPVSERIARAVRYMAAFEPPLCCVACGWMQRVPHVDGCWPVVASSSPPPSEVLRAEQRMQSDTPASRWFPLSPVSLPVCIPSPLLLFRQSNQMASTQGSASEEDERTSGLKKTAVILLLIILAAVFILEVCAPFFLLPATRALHATPWGPFSVCSFAPCTKRVRGPAPSLGTCTPRTEPGTHNRRLTSARSIALRGLLSHCHVSGRVGTKTFSWTPI